jgi:hypothetical protein
MATAGCASGSAGEGEEANQAVRSDVDVTAKPIAELAARLKRDPSELLVESQKKATFGDSCLDCANVGDSCTIGDVEGNTVVLRVKPSLPLADQPFEYHVDTRGEDVHFCTPHLASDVLQVPGPKVSTNMMQALASQQVDAAKVIEDARFLLADDAQQKIVERGFRAAGTDPNGAPIFLLDNPGIYTPGQRVIFRAGGPWMLTSATGVLEQTELTRTSATAYTLKMHYATRAP